MKQFRVAVVGTGDIARSHMDALREERARVDVVAAVDVVAQTVEKFCQEQDIPHGYTDIQTMLDEQKPDLVHICTPPGTHFSLSTTALRGGAHVFCEKPLVASLDEVDRLQAVERETGRTCSVVFQWRFGSGAQHLKRLIDAGELGRPLVGISNTTWYRSKAYYAVPWRGKWETEIGGTTMGHGIHAMDLLLWLYGDWIDVSAVMGTLDHEIEVEDISMAHVRFSSGAIGSIVNSVLSPREVSYMRFDFQRATVELEHLYQHTNANWRYSQPASVTHADDLAHWRAIQGDRPSSHAAQLTHILDALERGETPLTSGPQARATIEFLTALYKSAITRQWVARGTIDKDDPFYYHVYGETKPHLYAPGG